MRWLLRELARQLLFAVIACAAFTALYAVLSLIVHGHVRWLGREMSNVHVDYPDEVVHWFACYPEQQRARKVTGPCPHSFCSHNMTSTVAWGPSLRWYELLRCDVKDGCAGNCRGWVAATGASDWELMRRIEWRQLA